jgi:hypothetical protein
MKNHDSDLKQLNNSVFLLALRGLRGGILRRLACGDCALQANGQLDDLFCQGSNFFEKKTISHDRLRSDP